MLTRHFTGDYGHTYGRYSTTNYVFEGLGKATRATQRDCDIPAWAKGLPVSKVSDAHHIHFTALEIWESLSPEEQIKAAHVTRLPSDVTTTAAAGFMLWLASIPDHLHRQFIATDILDGADMMDVARRAKVLSVRAKSFQNIVATDLRDIFEIDVLVNRAFGQVDWAGEKENRVNVNGVRLSEHDAYTEALAIFGRPDATREMPRKLSWKKFFRMRWQWATAGSIHSQYKEDKYGLPKDHRLRTKFIRLIQMSDCDASSFLQRKPSLHAWSSYKYEWAKMRAIYGTDFTSYVIAHHAFYNCEEVLPNEFPVGPKANDSYVRGKMASILTDAVPLCVDYTDFNSQHTTHAMRGVLRAYRDVNARHLHPDQVKAMDWTIASLDNVVVHDNAGLREEYSAKGTLLSGWRLTTFVNSVLNKIYMAKLVSDKAMLNRAAHNGDDVILGIQSMKSALTMLRNARKYNIRLQPSKCALAGMAEFLRVEHRRGAHGQYLTRNIATLVHSRVESPFSTDWTQVISANEERLSEFVTRGGQLVTAARLRRQFVARRAQYYGTTEENMYQIRALHSVVGGLSTEKGARVDKVVEVTADTAGSELSEALPGVADYAVDVANTLGMRGDASIYSKIAARITRATLKAASYTTHSVKITQNDDARRSQVHLGIFKVFSKYNRASKFGKAKSVGMVLDIAATDEKLSLIQSNARLSTDPLTYISVVC